ncbi:hypothetical protein FHS38_006631 [Streptomyces netropsis]|uniref:Uncharacterized protein n=1 Tax=Streptomyces netropsis TaxID=55404 RepID=A0A7W7LJ25_STRNE|nr:hypothetical protein [Streptomyces netropsis]
MPICPKANCMTMLRSCRPAGVRSVSRSLVMYGPFRGGAAVCLAAHGMER